VEIAFDTETTGNNAWKGDRPHSISIAYEDLTTDFIHAEVDPYTRKVHWDKRSAKFKRFKRLLEATDVKKIAHNAKFDVRMVEGIGIHVPPSTICETMFAMHACNTQEITLELKPLCKKYFDLPTDDEKDLRLSCMRGRREGKKKGYRLANSWKADQHLADLALVKRYCCEDSVRAMLLWSFLKDLMDVEEVRHTYDLEMALWPITYAIEARGVAVNRDTVLREIAWAERRFKKMERELRKKCGSINLDSPDQLGAFLYTDKKGLRLPVIRRTDGGKRGIRKPSTDAKTLQELRHPWCDALMKFRAMEKALTSFFYKFRDLSVQDDEGRWILHPDFNQVGPVTGRYSCRAPNLQNVANALTTRSSEPIQARTAFEPRPDYWWYHFDYSQLEVRIFADVSKEPFMLQALRDGKDLHTECTNKAWGGKGNKAAVRAAIHALQLDGTGSEKSKLVKRALRKFVGKKYKRARQWLRSFNYDIVKAEKSLKKKTSRAKAKMLLFLKIFGGGAKAAADLMDCSTMQANEFLSDYDEAFPRISEYIRELSDEAKDEGYIRTAFGRKLRVHPKKAYRCVNYKVQGSAADLIKDRMVAVNEYLKDTGLDARIVLTIHDEIVLEVRKEHAYRWLLRKVKRIMEDHGGRFSIPLPVEIEKTTTTWNKKHKIGWAA
jgi:DNA polymerase-1